MDIPNVKKEVPGEEGSYSRPKNSLNKGSESDNSSASIKDLLLQHSSYDLLPISFKVILLDHHLPLKKALAALLHNGVHYAPLFNSETQKYSGLLSSNDFLSLIEYFYNKNYDEAIEELDTLEVGQVKKIEQEMGLFSKDRDLIRISPFDSLNLAANRILSANSHILPVIDRDPITQQDTVVTVLTQYRILKFLAVNYKAKSTLNITLKEIGIGSYKNILTAKLNDKVMDVVKGFMERRVAAVPILDENQVVLNVFENHDIMALLKEGDFSILDHTISDALMYRSESFEGVHRCQSSDTLKSIMETIKKEVVNRLIVVDDQDRLEGIVTLSDLLNYFLK
ncbi:CBS-domain-containing protein [Neoconidiobolus thromboides FSU 785]|nr:CBS-domain-containing protein [Neoconidiobolus thromboides FSU 785]